MKVEMPKINLVYFYNKEYFLLYEIKGKYIRVYNFS